MQSGGTYSSVKAEQIDEQLDRTARLRKMSQRRSFFQDARESLLQARPYRLWQSVMAYIRRFRMISFIVRLAGWMFTIVQTGALVLLTTAVFFVILPLLAVILAGALITALLDTRRSLHWMKRQLEDRRVYVFFGIDSPFGQGNAMSFAERENSAVLIVSPFWVSPRGLGRRKPYLNVRQERAHVYLIRRYFFFSLRKKLLTSDKTVLVY